MGLIPCRGSFENFFCEACFKFREEKSPRVPLPPVVPGVFPVAAVKRRRLVDPLVN